MCSIQNRCRMRRAVIDTSKLITSLLSPTRLVRIFQVDGLDPVRVPT
jgi:hypothetical protein